MAAQHHDLIRKAYIGFNARNIDQTLSTMHPDVLWPKAFDGGYVNGHDEIRQYWTKQWTEINPNVEPVGFEERKNGSLEVQVHQTVKELSGASMFDGIVKHVYTFQNGLIKRMDIELT